MKFVVEKLFVNSKKSTELIRITDKVRRTVQMTGLKNGIVNVFTLHTTTGITINEDDTKLEDDIARFMVKLVPEDDSYAHHRFFRKDGRMAVNAYSHIRASLLGANVTMPLQDGSLVLGSRQNIYLVDLDGPQTRGLIVQVVGE
ncbi:MAG: secondary thiamine-phosphate synthase enzyme YjbQ [Candidatus Bathyarchaeia archaeon]